MFFSPTGLPKSTPKSPLVWVAASVSTSSTIRFIREMAASASSSVTCSRRRSLALAVAVRMSDSSVLGVAPIWPSVVLLLSER